MLFVFPFTGAMCPFRHISGEKTVVCKHWLRGLCKKGDQCEFLHEYDMTKMPECYFYSKFGSVICHFPFKRDRIFSAKILFMFRVCAAGECSNKECPFLHIDPESKIKDCPWYDRGFCKHGKYCSVMTLIDFFLPAIAYKAETYCIFPVFRPWLQTQTYKKGDLCQLSGRLLSRRKIL